jgi:hypothetical protein
LYERLSCVQVSLLYPYNPQCIASACSTACNPLAHLRHLIEESTPPGLTFLFELIPKLLGLPLCCVGSLALAGEQPPGSTL